MRCRHTAEPMNPAPPVTSTFRCMRPPGFNRLQARAALLLPARRRRLTAGSRNEPGAARLERRPPFRQLQAVYATQLFVVEAGIGRAPRGRRVVRRGYALDAGQASPAPLRLAEDGF